MTLTVIPSSVPKMINVSGDSLDFTITADGSRVDITGDNHLVEVSMTESMANIRWYGLGAIWSSCLVGSNIAYLIPLHMYGEQRHSLESTTGLEGERILYNTGFDFNGFGFSGNYFFVLNHDSILQSTVYRFNITTLAYTTVVMSELTDGMIVYDDNTVYITGRKIGTPNTIAIWKVDFGVESYSLVGEFDLTTTYNGNNYEWGGGQYVSRCKYGSLDRIVYVSIFSYSGEEAPLDHGDIICVCMFDLNNSIEFSQEFIDGGNGLYALFGDAFSGVQQYKDKAIFNFNLWSLEDAYEGILCACPFFVVNLNTGDIYRGDSHDGAYPDYYEEAYPFSAIDSNNGIYYFWTNENTQGQNHLRKVSLSSFSPIAELSSDWTNDFPIPISGMSNAYVDLADNLNLASTTDELTTVTLNPILADMSATSNSRKVVDDTNDMVWALNNDQTTLEGFSALVGGSDTSISIDWGVQSPPAGTKCALIMPYKGYCAILMFVPRFSEHLYLLRPTP